MTRAMRGSARRETTPRWRLACGGEATDLLIDTVIQSAAARAMKRPIGQAATDRIALHARFGDPMDGGRPTRSPNLLQS